LKVAFGFDEVCIGQDYLKVAFGFDEVCIGQEE
jgi:hypothetical protein